MRKLNESSEMLKELCVERGIEFKPQYATALGKLLEIFDEDLAFAMLQKADERLTANETTMNMALQKAEGLNRTLIVKERDLIGLVSRAEKAIESMKAVTDDRLDDSKNAETVRLFRMMLKAGVEVFGADRMTEGAIDSICKAASYSVWGTIKKPDEEPKYNGKRF